MINFWLVMFFFSLFAIFMNVHNLIYLDLPKFRYAVSVFMVIMSFLCICLAIFKIIYIC